MKLCLISDNRIISFLINIFSCYLSCIWKVIYSLPKTIKYIILNIKKEHNQDKMIINMYLS